MTLSHYLLLFLVVLFLRYCSVESADPSEVYCNKDTKIGSEKASANIDKILVELVSKASTDGFLATSHGCGKNRVYGLAQCRGDVDNEDCSACVQDAAKHIRMRCPNEADARIWFEYCFLRYSKTNFIGEVDTDIEIHYYHWRNVSEPERFNEELGNMTDHLISQAVKVEKAGLGKGQIKFTSSITLYAMVQCTRDLSSSCCAYCLDTAVSNFHNFCNNKEGCRVIYSSCNARYELYPFF